MEAGASDPMCWSRRATPRAPAAASGGATPGGVRQVRQRRRGSVVESNSLDQTTSMMKKASVHAPDPRPLASLPP